MRMALKSLTTWGTGVAECSPMSQQGLGREGGRKPFEEGKQKKLLLGHGLQDEGTNQWAKNQEKGQEPRGAALIFNEEAWR